MSTKKIKDNIQKKDFRFLMNFIEADTSIRETRKNRLQKIFSVLWCCGLRVNEVPQINEEIILGLLSVGKSKIQAYKQKKEKFIYITEKDKKLISLYWNSEKGFNIESERTQKTLNHLSVIRDVNTYLKKVFPNKNITSHSFRQTLITDLANKQINPSVIQHIVGHKNISTTLGYVKPSEENLISALEMR